MFCVQIDNCVNYMDAQGILAYYDVRMDSRVFNGKHTIIVDGENREGDERLCEMAFQASFHQEGNLCPVCRDKIEITGEGVSVCGHLTFTRPIKPVFKEVP